MKITHAIVVDDDPILRYSIKKMMSGYIDTKQFNAFACGTDALEHIQQMYLPDASKVLILLDIHMPFLSGTEFLKKFKEKLSDRMHQFNIHILSSSNSSEEKKKLVSHSLVKSFISKPITIQELETIINE